ncbi:MAG: hypothetical protein RBR47_02320 [Bacteroidales bacterium]|jgi:hypothetical protein|nr:hypothetical protein [Bacteroidales bacterium]MDD2631241.1 hypothetical protein [Bacteroidales bacterium]MDD3130857.1 hypothetical protein [Bacteroidales bacterium]MDD3526223.1 hypothetical protein [Bacteroidales bacterium]MDD4175707.1 hypothetical protein [Bacteroidales bacterium]
MKIINPLYDKAFKYLMENEKFARKVLSVILDVEVEKVTLGHQETIFPDERRQLTLFRLDFKAVIKQADGSSKTVLIELQKSKYSTDIQRFRNYLGANYISKKKIKDRVSESRVTYQPTYPLILIYILGYNLEEIPYMAITVDREIINSVNKKRINIRSAFIEQLTHQAHIIQVRRLPERRRTRLEKFLMLFNQAWVTDEGYIIDLQEIPEEFSDIAHYLQGPVMDEAFRRKLEAEEELDTIFDEQEAKYKQKIAEAEKRENEAKKAEKILARKLALHLKKSGTSIEEIQRETGLDKRTIEEL